MSDAVNVRNILVLLGIVIATAGVIYFAVEFIDVISPWGRVASLLLLGTVFISLGAHYDVAGEATDVVARDGWRWLRVTNALYILGTVAAFASVIAFFAVPDLDRIWKVAATIGLGLGLILSAAKRTGHMPQR